MASERASTTRQRLQQNQSGISRSDDAKSTRPEGSGDPGTSQTGYGNSGFALVGEICASCGIKLADESPTPGERLCAKCRFPGIHRISMYYLLRKNWMGQ